jgi:hypothetical protein
MPELAAHDMFTHRDGRVCILVEDGTWFVPLDAGGEGYACEREHGPAHARLEREVRQLRAALVMYADPSSYHAIFFMPDRPCGWFIDDFSEDHGDDFYDRPMPGARARAALRNSDEIGELQNVKRDERAMGWERAHTTMCPRTNCREHRNPWQRTRGTT